MDSARVGCRHFWRMLPSKSWFGPAGLALLSFLVAGLVSAESLSDGGTMFINKFGYYRKVWQNCGATMFIPTNASAEWTSFLNYKPACAGAVEAVTVPIAENEQPPNGYHCSNEHGGSVQVGVGDSLSFYVNCYDGFWPGGSRLKGPGEDLIRYCTANYLGGVRWRIDCGAVPSYVNYAQYWNSPP